MPNKPLVLKPLLSLKNSAPSDPADPDEELEPERPNFFAKIRQTRNKKQRSLIELLCLSIVPRKSVTPIIAVWWFFRSLARYPPILKTGSDRERKIKKPKYKMYPS